LNIDYSILAISFSAAAKICKYAVYAKTKELIFWEGFGAKIC